MTQRKIAVPWLMLLLAASAAAAQQNGPIVTGRGYLSENGLRPGSGFKLAVVLNIRKGFHIGAAVPRADWPAKLEVHSSPDITFDLPKYPTGTMKPFAFSGGEKIPVYEGRITIFVGGRVAKDAAPGRREITARLAYQACDEHQCFAPSQITVSLPARVVSPGERVSETNPEVFGPRPASAVGTAKPASGSAGVESAFGKGELFGFISLFGLGLLLSFSPCVYPMAPITIGYFAAQTERRTARLMLLAGFYILGMALTYSVLGAAAALTGGIFGSALQNPYVPIGIAIVLIALALGMFGLYEFRVPASIAAKSQGRRGAIGALSMGLLFGVVAAPCVGPVVVGLLVLIAKSGNPIFGFFAFFVLALGLGTPFFFLATFSGAINRLPQAGAWMLSVRKVAGLLLIGAAIYYLVPFIRAHVSERAADLALPTLIMLSGIYLGWLETSLRKLPKIRIARPLAGLAIVALGALFAFMPMHRRAPMKFEPYTEAAVARAASAGKPVMIDFSAEWCQACKELDRRTFPDPKVKAEGERFVRLRADETHADSPKIKAREKKYAILGLPTIVFLDGSGREVESARVVGFIEPDKLVEKMRAVR